MRVLTAAATKHGATGEIALAIGDAITEWADSIATAQGARSPA